MLEEFAQTENTVVESDEKLVTARGASYQGSREVQLLPHACFEIIGAAVRCDRIFVNVRKDFLSHPDDHAVGENRVDLHLHTIGLGIGLAPAPCDRLPLDRVEDRINDRKLRRGCRDLRREISLRIVKDTAGVRQRHRHEKPDQCRAHEKLMNIHMNDGLMPAQE